MLCGTHSTEANNRRGEQGEACPEKKLECKDPAKLPLRLATAATAPHAARAAYEPASEMPHNPQQDSHQKWCRFANRKYWTHCVLQHARKVLGLAFPYRSGCL
mmetsp:Transcript_66804/g.138553  ORF Transcript_66804/g.138553 Transcript_66804/m.138553 type:complete len:103 (-) Transcript_66804:165-473(-)